MRNWTVVAKRHGLIFNSAKCEIKVPQIKFFGMIYDKDAVHPDPEKVKDIKERQSPEDKTELQEFQGIITYMFPFILRLSEHTPNLRNLLKKDPEYAWTQVHQPDFEKVKDLILILIFRETILSYFDLKEETIIQVDASGVRVSLFVNR